MMSTTRCNEWRGEPFFSLSLSLICLLRKMIHCELSLSNFDSWCRGKEDKDNVVLYFDSWPRQEQCITLPLKQVNLRILGHCHQHLPPVLFFFLEGHNHPFWINSCSFLTFPPRTRSSTRPSLPLCLFTITTTPKTSREQFTIVYIIYRVSQKNEI